MFQEYSTPAFEEKFTYTGDDLGCRWTRERTRFRLWAPTAADACVLLYKGGTEGTSDLIKTLPMDADCCGTWVACAEGDWNGVYYTYRVTVGGQSVETIDPYAVSAGINGHRGMILDLESTNPAGWESDTGVENPRNYTDDVIYELHVRDLSADASSGIAAKGKFLGLTETDTATEAGNPTGLSHIRQLGVTHVHLLPIYDFGSVDEAHPDRSYNWGYDPVNYNLPEGSYSTDPRDGATRVRELKQAVLSLHQNGLGVIMDVVYNHVYHTFEFSVNRLVPGYFSRENADGKLSGGSCCGNDTASERSMVRKFIVDSVRFWADEYHLDGFRFDIVGLLDVQTMQEVIASVRKKHPHMLFYGEGWDMPTELTKPDIPLAVQKNAFLVPELGFFNDTIRDTLRGSIFDRTLPGYISGAPTDRQQLLRCFRGEAGWNQSPCQVINYVSCHDDLTLHDRIATALPGASEAELARRSRFAAAFNLLSIGVPFFQAGEELLRSKKNRAGGFDANSYRSPDSVNAIRWGRLKNAEVQKTLRYYRGLLALRRAHSLFRIADAETAKRAISLMEAAAEELAVFRLEDETEIILAAFNPGTGSVPLALPQGSWRVCVTENEAAPEGVAMAQGEALIAPISAFVAILSKAQ